nr:MAG TPA: putative endoribonuclease [Caudoviricetes sp.]
MRGDEKVTQIKRCTLRIPKKLHDELQAIAKEGAWTFNGLVKRILCEWLEEQEAKRHEG